MIAFLRGKLVGKASSNALIDIQGIGYQVEISANTFAQLPSLEQTVTLQIYHHITENEQRLFGFYTEDEKRLFQQLITVKSIGPKLGLSILSGMEPRQIIEAIQYGNHKSLAGINGVGKKTAERLVLELKDNMGDISVDEMEPEPLAGNAQHTTQEVIAALESLGYSSREANKAAIAAQKDQAEDTNVSDLVKRALFYMSR